MVVTHYGYLVLKMPSPKGVLKIRGDRDAGVSVLEKLSRSLGAKTSHHRARTSVARPQHPACNPKMTP
jgi:hypothetical protein